jgi:hypothetical protein
LSEYDLKSLGHFLEYKMNEDDIGIRCGLQVTCPGCGMWYSAWFVTPLTDEWAIQYPRRPRWNATGDTIETLTLEPTFFFGGHCRAQIRDGKVIVETPFTCCPENDELNA